MANIQERRNNDGKLVSYSIRVFRGRDAKGKQLKPYTASFTVEKGWSEKTARKRAEAFAANFEEQCKQGIITDTRQKFEPYADYVISLKEQNGVKHTTICSYKYLATIVYPLIGHIQLKNLRVDDLNRITLELSKDGMNRKTGGKLSAKTIKECHHFVSVVLEQALKEGLIPINLETRIDMPKQDKKAPNYFQPEQIATIRENLENEPIKWKTIVHLLLLTGARRGEILGLKWSDIDFVNNQLHICRNVLYRPDVGVYVDTPKTEKSDRWVALPVQTMRLLKEYQGWQMGERLRLQEYYQNQDFLFAQDNGNPMFPDSVTRYLSRFGERIGFHVNPHAFRHTMASMLYFNGIDSVSISARLGHSSVSITQDIYSHVIKTADRRNADVLANIFLEAT